MKNKIINNLGLKILSVLCALLLWIIVLNISDYTMTVSIDDIPVEQLNGDVLTDLDKVYDVSKGDTVDITVKGRRSIVTKLSASDFIATADLSTMSITNTVQIFVTAKNKDLNDNITIVCKDNAMTLNLEEKVTMQFPIKTSVIGSPDEKYAVGDISVTPNIVTITGPESAVNRITEARIHVNVTGQKESFDVSTSVEIYDAYGEQIINDKLEMAQNLVTANVNIYPVKEIPVELTVNGTPKDGYEVAEVNFQPQSIVVAGDTESLSSISKIVIDDISISGMQENFETVIKLSDYLPDGIIIAQQSDELALTVVIEKLNKKEIVLTDKDIVLDGTDVMYDYTVKVSDNFRIIVYGLGDSVDAIDLSTLKPMVKCKSLSHGSNNNVTLELQDIEGITYEIKGSITILIQEK